LFFDDRLATVLRQRVTGETGLRTQFRQLLDLLGNARLSRLHGHDHSLVAAAWLRMDALAEAIPAAERARMIREPGWRFRSPDLAAHLAEHEPEVAAAALGRAQLSGEDWSALIPRLPVRARGFLRLRRDLPVDAEALLARLGIHDRGLPAPPTDAAATPPPAADDAPDPVRSLNEEPVLSARFAVISPTARGRDRDDTGRTEISALVERIAQFRRERSETLAEIERSPRLPLGELPEQAERSIASFGFATDAAGRIVWASSEAAAMVIGTRLAVAAGFDSAAGESDMIARAFVRRQPIVAAETSLEGAPAIAGDWIVDAQPHFSTEGHFTGYFGRFRRLPANPAPAMVGDAREADRIRQLLHELRTPVTAVQGYAEVIQQQLFGPAPNEYRALAAAIAADAARILAGFDELDRLARIETGVLAIEPGVADLAALARQIADQLAPVLSARGAAMGFDLGADTAVLIALDPDDAEALVWRVLASIGAACDEGERITGRIDPVIGGAAALARLTIGLPTRLAQEYNLFAATARGPESAINAGLFGTGFALRLARAEAAAAGGSLVRGDGVLTLSLPLVTGAEPARIGGAAG
jgi:signal transduction histidine kinase